MNMNPITYIKKRLYDRRLNIRRDAAVIRGEFVYFIIADYTNIRKRSASDEAIIYHSGSFAEEQCDWDERVVSVAAYDRIYDHIYTGKW